MPAQTCPPWKPAECCWGLRVSLIQIKYTYLPTYHFVFLLLCLPVFVAKRIFQTHQHVCFLCFHSRWRFFWFHKHREITKNPFTLAENNLGERKLSCTRLNFGQILFARTIRAVPGGQYRSILPARVANQNIEFAAYYPLPEVAI